MSIINKVLQEIEKNKHRNAQPSQPPNLNLYPSLNSGKYKIFSGLNILIALLIVLIVIIAVFYFTSHQVHNHKHPLTGTSAALVAASKQLPASGGGVAKSPKVPPAAGYAQPEKAAAVKLEDITFSVDKSKTFINFKLSGETYYYLEHGQEQQQLILILGNTSYDRPINPEIAHTAIKKMQLQRSDHSVKVDLNLLPDTQIISLQFSSGAAGAQPILQLVLLNTSIQAGSVSKEVVPLTAAQRATQEYEDALNLVAHDEDDIAIEKLSNIVRIYKGDVNIYELLATLLIKSDRLGQALRILNEAIARYPNNHHLVQLKAGVWSQQGQSQKALQLLLQNPPAINDDPNYYAYVANAYQQQGQFMVAANLYDRLVKIQPSNAAWWVDLGIALESASQNNAAREAYYHALELGGNLPQAVQNFLQSKVGTK